MRNGQPDDEAALVAAPWGLLAFVAIAALYGLRRVRAGILEGTGSQGEPSSMTVIQN